jgi:hypothetical protein
MNTYKIVVTEDGVESLQKTLQDGTIWGIPKDPDNTDYQAYLKWLDEGNTPQPADSGE